MTKHLEKQRKQDLGIFYTPPKVVNFIFDILNVWKEKEDREKKRWQSRLPKPHYPSVVDPAVGEGVFLKGALENNFTKPNYVFGIDIDETVTKRWEEINLLISFGSRADLENHFFHQNGLLPLKEDKVLRYKTGGLKEFDVAVGNPPYGGIGVDFDGKLSPANMKLLEALEKYEIFTHKKALNGKPAETNEQSSLFATSEAPVRRGNVGKAEVIKLAQGMPIEILFVERFIQLVKPEGWVAIIIPDGILSNSNAHYVRDFISLKSKVEMVVSLPRGTFKQAGTSAKTSILFLRKLGENEKPPLEHRVFLATADKVSKDSFNQIVETYKQYYNSNNTMKNSNLVQIMKDNFGRETSMVRVDLTLKDLMEEKPTSRWDVEYWHKKYDQYLKMMERGDYEVKALGELNDFYITTGSGSERIYTPNGGVKYIQNINVRNTGVDFLARAIEIKENSEIDRIATRVKLADVIFNRSGMGTLGRTICISSSLGKANISNDVYLIRNSEVNQHYLATYLMTEIGQAFIDRESHGVSGLTKINTEDIKKIPIPLIKLSIQANIESEYKKMSAYHDKAMEAKKKNDEAGYKKNIEKAEKMLKDLIAKTEAVIRGERKNVI